jgi:ubiquitin conjugation factor E4 B
MSLRTHQTELLDIINHIIRTGKEPRERTLDWFARSVNLNHKRRAMQVDKTKVSSDGYMINLTVCLDQLCEPFMDSTFSKVDRIDVAYLRRNPRVDIKEETKLNADQQTSDNFYAEPAEEQSNFISEIFFLTLAAHHYGTEAAGSMLTELERTLRHMEKSIDKLEAELASDRQKMNPVMIARVEKALKDWKDQLEKGTSYRHAVHGVLLDDLNQARSMQFMRYVMVWLLRLVTPAQDFPESRFKLPLPEEQKMVFRCLPEYFLEDVVGNFKFISRNMPHIITATQADELVMLCITFLRSGEYVKNPYLKAGLVTIMYAGSVPYVRGSKGVLQDILHAHPFATDYLLHALMKFFIDAEHTGAHTAFYDKFNIRYEIFQIIKCIWSNPVYRDQLSAEAKDNVEFFVQFVNLLMNDVTYVLDESLSSFAKIHDLQQELRNPAALEEQQRTEKQEALSEAQGKAKNFMVLTNEGVSMMKLFTETLADSFTKREIVQRLADMLDYNLDAMVGPKSSQLKVENPDEYGFNPKVLLAEIIDVYLNLQKKENFVFAVARDGRSYKPANFDNATLILKKYMLKSPEGLKDWQDLAEKFKKAKEVDDQAEEDLGEIPDEFIGTQRRNVPLCTGPS